MGLCYNKDVQSEQYITTNNININEKTPLINNDIGNIQILNSSDSNSDGYCTDYEDNISEVFIKTYDQYSTNELFDDLEKQNDPVIINVIIKTIGNKMNIMSILEINSIWEKYHVLICNKIKNCPWLCIDLKLYLVSKNDKIKYIEKLATVIYETFPNESVILLHINTQKATTLIKQRNGKYCEYLTNDNVRQQIMVNNALVALSKRKYGLSYLLLLKAGRYSDAYNIFYNFVPDYVKILTSY